MSGLKVKFLSIGDVSKLTGVHIKSLRYYDRIGVLKPAYVDPQTQYRYYSAAQLGMIYAIRTCIELDIPLKDFGAFARDGHTVDYSALLAYGKEIANKKMRAIRGGLKVIDEMQRAIQEDEALLHRTYPTSLPMERRTYLLAPAEEVVNDINDPIFANDALFFTAQERRMKAGYEYGLLYLYGDAGVERYYFLQILSPVKKGAADILQLEPMSCRALLSKESRIDDTPAIFPEMFESGGRIVAIEAELFNGQYDVDNPYLMLRCARIS